MAGPLKLPKIIQFKLSHPQQSNSVIVATSHSEKARLVQAQPHSTHYGADTMQ